MKKNHLAIIMKSKLDAYSTGRWLEQYEQDTGQFPNATPK